MKKKFDKLLTERPRKGARFKMNRMKQKDAEALPTKIGVRRHRLLNGTRSKWLNENLSPLRRFLLKQAGRPWDKVYSEICEEIRLDNEVQRHILIHLDDFVAQKVYVDDDGNWRNSERRWFVSWPQYGPVLYVDPNDGILKRTKKLCRKLGIVRKGWRDGDKVYARVKASGKPKREIEHVRIDGRRFNKIAGLWYEILPKPKAHLSDPEKPHPKRQLSRKDLKTYGLENDP